MDPVTVVSLTANIAQFLEVAFKIVQGTYEVASSPTGLLAKHEEADLIAHSIAGLHQNIVNLSSTSTSKDSLSELDKNLLPLRRTCITVGNELLNHLKRLKVSGQRKKWKNLRTALLSLMREGKMRELESRLMNLQRQIDSVVISDIQKQQTAILNTLQSNSQHTHQNLRVSEDLLSITTSIEESLESLRSRSGISNPSQREKPLPQNQNENLYKIIPLAEKAQLLALQQTFLASLDYEMRLSRDQSIKKAHAETFQWIFRETVEGDNEKPIHLLRWLEEDNGVFWITGKPGSGKSTLMRYLWNEEQTHTALRKWAENGQSGIATACFYFWNSGTVMQRSLEGMLRSLLIQVLDQCPELAPKIFPGRWKLLQSMQAMSIKGLSGQTLSPATASWNVEELLQAFRVISAEASISSRFCFFIDGLDEYDGTDKEMVDIIASFGVSKFIKFCLSSRPHVHFNKAYGQDSLRSLSISTLTTGDIWRYVHDNLTKNQAFQDLSAEYPDRCEKLVNDIVGEANGVFLWVYLVVVRLLEGIEVNNDRMGDLEKKLQRTPKELKQLFRMIIDSVESDYHEPQAHMFRAACAATEPLNLTTYYFMDFEDEEHISKLPLEPMKDHEITDKQNAMATRISVRCKGLLEVIHSSDLRIHTFQKRKVELIHRTFRDFLVEGDMQDLMKRRSAPGFDPYRAICLGLFAEFKSCEMGMEKEVTNQQFKCLLQLVHYAGLWENEQCSSAHNILDEVLKMLLEASRQFSQVAEKLWSGFSCDDEKYWSGGYEYLLRSSQHIPFQFTQLAAFEGLVDYSKEQVAKLLSPETSLDDLLLKAMPYNVEVEHLNFPHYFLPRNWLRGRVPLIKLLLEMGANANMLWDKLVFFHHYRDVEDDHFPVDRYFSDDYWESGLIKLLLVHTQELPDEARVLFHPSWNYSASCRLKMHTEHKSPTAASDGSEWGL
ncbi:hypothetical protein DM02DRAFT_23062 [Periconia macrospinosa]|uniref:NACHT domain-containing protein n=1 Tax=Periconia macrospinosa TaxID=97972 RepID=A0A2V1DLB9_9PLEO|nr:hypothetical protein DM02DRAFT_23062 [Periconia macrospinosa]